MSPPADPCMPPRAVINAGRRSSPLRMRLALRDEACPLVSPSSAGLSASLPSALWGHLRTSAD